MSDALKSLGDLVTDYDTKIKAMKEELSKTFQNEFKVIFAEIFATYPNVKKVSWTQYTPYFNDGDACVFSVHGVMVADDTIDEEEDSIYDWVEVDYGEGSKKYPLIKQFSDVLQRSDDILLQMFGDHTQVTVTPNGIDADEYSHD